MKQSLFLAIAAFAFFSSCEEGLLDQKIDTTLSKTLVADVTDEGTKSTLYSFSVTDTLSLEDNNDVDAYLDKIKDIAIKSATCTLQGIPADEEIAELVISLDQANLTVSLSNLTENNSSLALAISSTDIAADSSFLKAQKMLIITVSGKSTYAPMELFVTLNFETTITASPLK